MEPAAPGSSTPPRDERLLRGGGNADPAEAHRVLRRAVRLREALYPIFAQADQSGSRPHEDLDVAARRAGRRHDALPCPLGTARASPGGGKTPGPGSTAFCGPLPGLPPTCWSAGRSSGSGNARGPELRLAVPRPQQERQQALVRDALVRQPGQSASPLCADAGRQPGLAVRCCAADGRTADGGGHVVCVPAAASAGSGLVSWTGAGSRGCRPRWAAACHTRARLRRRRSRRRRPG